MDFPVAGIPVGSQRAGARRAARPRSDRLFGLRAGGGRIFTVAGRTSVQPQPFSGYRQFYESGALRRLLGRLLGRRRRFGDPGGTPETLAVGCRMGGCRAGRRLSAGSVRFACRLACRAAGAGLAALPGRRDSMDGDSRRTENRGGSRFCRRPVRAVRV